MTPREIRTVRLISDSILLKPSGSPSIGAARVEVRPQGTRIVCKAAQRKIAASMTVQSGLTTGSSLHWIPLQVLTTTLSEIVNQIQCPYNPAAV